MSIGLLMSFLLFTYNSIANFSLTLTSFQPLLNVLFLFAYLFYHKLFTFSLSAIILFFFFFLRINKRALLLQKSQQQRGFEKFRYRSKRWKLSPQVSTAPLTFPFKSRDQRAVRSFFSTISSPKNNTLLSFGKISSK